MPDVGSMPPTQAMIGKWSVDRYMGLIRRWVLGAGLLVLLLMLGRQSRVLAGGLEIITLIGTGWLVVRRDGGKIEGLAAGTFTGSTLGLAVAIGRWLAGPTLTNGLLIIAEPVITAILGALLCVSAILLFRLARKPTA